MYKCLQLLYYIFTKYYLRWSLLENIINIVYIQLFHCHNVLIIHNIIFQDPLSLNFLAQTYPLYNSYHLYLVAN